MSTIHSGIFRVNRTDNCYEISYFLRDNINEPVKIALQAIPISSLETASDFSCYAEQVEQQPTGFYCTDVQPINGHYCEKNLLKGLIRPQIVNELCDQKRYSQNRLLVSRVQLFVLDIKDSKNRYTNIDEIEKAEDELAIFLRQPEPKSASSRKSFHNLISDNGIGFFLKEGKLKHRIVSSLPLNCAEFLQNDVRGRGELCQLSEIIMNFLKIGLAVRGLPLGKINLDLHPQDFFVSTATRSAPHSQHLALNKIQKISLITLYPSHYKEM